MLEETLHTIKLAINQDFKELMMESNRTKSFPIPNNLEAVRINSSSLLLNSHDSLVSKSNESVRCEQSNDRHLYGTSSNETLWGEFQDDFLLH